MTQQDSKQQSYYDFKIPTSIPQNLLFLSNRQASMHVHPSTNATRNILEKSSFLLTLTSLAPATYILGQLSFYEAFEWNENSSRTLTCRWQTLLKENSMIGVLGKLFAQIIRTYKVGAYGVPTRDREVDGLEDSLGVCGWEPCKARERISRDGLGRSYASHPPILHFAACWFGISQVRCLSRHCRE